MNTLRIVQALLLLLLTVSLFPFVQAIEPAWIYPINDTKIGNIAISSDASTIIVAAENLWIFSKDGTLIKKEPYGESVVLTPNGRYAASFFGNTIYFFSTPLTTGTPDPKQLNKVWEYEVSNPVLSVDITDSGNTIVAATSGNGVCIITTQPQKFVSNNTFPNTLVRISHDGGRIVGLSTDKIRLYGSNAKPSKTYNLASVTQPDFMALSQTVPLMVYNDAKTIHSVDLSIGTELWYARAAGYPKALAMTSSGSFVVVGTDNGNIERYDDKGALNWSYSSSLENKPDAEITGIALSKDGSLVAAGSNDGKILLLNTYGNLLGSYQTNDPIHSMAMSSDGSTVIAAGDKNIYAFSTGYKPSPASSTVSRTLPQGTLNTTSQNITAPQNLTRQPVVPTHTKVSVERTITELPTEYSVIKTSKQSPLSDLIPLGGLVVAWMLLVRRR